MFSGLAENILEEEERKGEKTKLALALKTKPKRQSDK